MSRPEENLQFWKLVAQEHNCFDQPYPIANDQARFLFYREPSPDLHNVPHENFSATVTLMSGLPGSGKDTWLAKHRPDLPVVSLDQIRSELDVAATDDQGRCRPGGERTMSPASAITRFVCVQRHELAAANAKALDRSVCRYGARIEIVYIEPPLPAFFVKTSSEAAQFLGM